MLKKISLALLIAAALVITLLNVLSKKAPIFLKDALEKSLNKKVTITDVIYSFPGTFKLEGFSVDDQSGRSPEPLFYADDITLDVSLLSLSQKNLLIDKIRVENASVVVRHKGGRLSHVLSNAAPKELNGPRSLPDSADKKLLAKASPLPLTIKDFYFQKCNFKYIDYDAGADGFVMAFSEINAHVTDITLPASPVKTTISLKAKLIQTRDERPADVYMDGWMKFDNLDGDLNFGVTSLYLPMFKPYYSKITYAIIETGNLDAKANVRINQKDLSLNVDAEARSLYFQSYESDDQLFGLRAEQLLLFLKDRSGKLKFQIVARWNMTDRSVRAKDIIRKSMEKSLKNTVLSNVGNILENAIQRIGEGGIENSKDKVEEAVKKIKDFFKY